MTADGDLEPIDRRWSLTWQLWVPPLAGALFALGVASALYLDWLNASSRTGEALILVLALIVLAASLMLGVWQHQAIVRPLRQLALKGTADGAGAGLALVRGMPREIVALSIRIRRAPPPAMPERDPLTGLLTSTGLHDAALSELEAARGSGARYVLLVADIYRLREINGSHGYMVGDEVLRHIGRRLATVGHASSVVARIGGDRFALMLPLAQAQDGLPAWSAAVTEALNRPLCISGCSLNPSIRAGIAIFPDHGASFQHLMRAADLSLEAACRDDSRRWHVFEPRMDQVATAHRAMEQELRQAMERKQLCLHYQPQVDLTTGSVIGVEALLRWPHPEKGFIPPQSFIPVAEASGLIRPLGAWVLTEACLAARRWQDQGLRVNVSVNVSAAQLRYQELAVLVGRVLQTTSLPPELLELELTESMFVDPTELAMRRSIQNIAAMGVRLAIDDFGTGYSSLGYLKRLPVHKIKIDKSFVRELGQDEADAAIVRSIISLACTFGKRVLAEGVEELSQFQFLLREGCHEAQGYYFARPMPEAACTTFLLRNAAGLEPVQPSSQLRAG